MEVVPFAVVGFVNMARAPHFSIVPIEDELAAWALVNFAGIVTIVLLFISFLVRFVNYWEVEIILSLDKVMFPLQASILNVLPALATFQLISGI